MSEFIIENGVLKKYNGAGGDVVIPNGVTRIHNFAFLSHSGAVTVTVPESVSQIGDCAFYGCRNLVSVTIKGGVTRIGANAFHACFSLVSVTIPDTVRQIGEGAFKFCRSLKEVTLPNGLLRLPRHMFAVCESLVSVTLPDSIQRVDGDVFARCSSLTDIRASERVHALVWNAMTTHTRELYCCHQAVEGIPPREYQKRWFVGLRDEIVRMAISLNKEKGLPNMMSIKHVPLEKLNEWIDDSENAPCVRAFFMGCKNSWYSAEELERLETEMMEKELGLRRRTVEDWRRIFMFKTERNSVTVTKLVAKKTIVEIPSVIGATKVTKIGARAFYGCDTVTDVFIPDSVTEIEKSAFLFCCLTLHGKAGGCAEIYAKENNIPFHAI